MFRLIRPSLAGAAALVAAMLALAAVAPAQARQAKHYQYTLTACGATGPALPLGSLPLSSDLRRYLLIIQISRRVSAKEDPRAASAGILLRIASRSETGRQGPNATPRPSRGRAAGTRPAVLG